MENNVVMAKNGWEKLYQPIIDNIVEYDKKQSDAEHKIGIDAIGSKNGLMFVNLYHPESVPIRIQNIINDNIAKSAHMCERCGTKLEVGTTMNYQIETCCRKCWHDRILPSLPHSMWKETF